VRSRDITGQSETL